MPNTYVQPISQQIHSQLQDTLFAGYHALKKAEWKEGTKPQNKQLEAVHNTSSQMDSLYDSKFKYHLPVVRIFKEPCPLTKECLNQYQLYRKKGLLALLTKLFPDLGKVVAKKPLLKKSKAERDEDAFMLFDHNRMTGRRGEDWAYFELNGKIYKGVMRTPVGRLMAEAELIALGGGAIASQMANNNCNDLLTKRARAKADVALARQRGQNDDLSEFDTVMLWDRLALGEGRRGQHWNWVTIGREIYKVDAGDQNGFAILSNERIQVLGTEAIRRRAEDNTERALHDRNMRTGSRRLPRRGAQLPHLRMDPARPQEAFNEAVGRAVWGLEPNAEQAQPAEPELQPGAPQGPGDVVIAEAEGGFRVLQDAAGAFRWVVPNR